MSYSPYDREHVFSPYAFMGSADESLRRLGEFIAIHIPEHRDIPRQLLHNLERAAYESRSNILKVTTPTRWNLGRLLVNETDRWTGKVERKLRKPRIVEGLSRSLRHH